MSPSPSAPRAHHHLVASVETTHWGWFQSTLKPVLTIDSGDRVTVQTVSGGPANLPGPGYHVPPELLQIHQRSERRLPGHILTGPIHVRDAEPGDVLELRIVDVQCARIGATPSCAHWPVRCRTTSPSSSK
jgi:acetamidase/formamidase